jgi:hypothetical protein
MYIWMYDMIVYISDRSQTLDRLHSFKVLEERRTALIRHLNGVARERYEGKSCGERTRRRNENVS